MPRGQLRGSGAALFRRATHVMVVIHDSHRMTYADRMRLPIHRGERDALAGELDVLHNTYRSVKVGLFTITRPADRTPASSLT